MVGLLYLRVFLHPVGTVKHARQSILLPDWDFWGPIAADLLARFSATTTWCRELFQERFLSEKFGVLEGHFACNVSFMLLVLIWWMRNNGRVHTWCHGCVSWITGSQLFGPVNLNLRMMNDLILFCLLALDELPGQLVQVRQLVMDLWYKICALFECNWSILSVRQSHSSLCPRRSRCLLRFIRTRLGRVPFPPLQVRN